MVWSRLTVLPQIFVSYGSGYWLSRSGHKGVGTDLRRLGAGSPSDGGGQPNETLKRALRASRQPKQAKKRGAQAGGSAAKSGTKKAKRKAVEAARPTARGFGS